MSKAEAFWGGFLLVTMTAYAALGTPGCLKGGSVQQNPDGTVTTCEDWAKKNPAAACDAACAAPSNVQGGK